MKLFVAGLPFDMDDQELSDIFSDYGTVASAKIINDRDTGKSRGFGFVDFSDSSQAEAAMTALNGATLAGRQMTVKPAEDKRAGGSGARGGFSGRGAERKGGFDRDRRRF